ncbi:MAG: hypothetical protein JNM58_06765 [Xanthomonadaceae bacterium]|nr:hypothetical protein [Xanthomonadaceae bacterium]
MKTKFSLCLSLVAAFWACGANAQNAAPECPNLPKDAVDSLTWQVLRTPDMLLCRAMRAEDGKEAFAVTIGRSSPFKPNSSLRDGESTIDGQKTYWYRSEIAGKPNELIRETLVKVAPNNVAHVFIRTDSAENLGRYKEMVQGLQFSTSFAGN